MIRTALPQDASDRIQPAQSQSTPMGAREVIALFAAA
jgi:hypothetical protein